MRSTKFDWDMIAAATKQFSTYRKIGERRVWFHLYGVLPTATRQLVAIKRFSPSSTQLNHSEFQNEIHLLSNLQHRNIIKLPGYCIHREEKLIVYEFMENATLYTLLGGRSATTSSPPMGRMLQNNYGYCSRSCSSPSFFGAKMKSIFVNALEQLQKTRKNDLYILGPSIF
ncbi:hypothetical protein OROMI_029939 [Orobanche minor]